ncbi:CD3e molecule, epsilon associated protein isoform X2 [Syngnathoides biaculeatus]|uniref:CD3e molecule, epsilon associated protein isoform X2 n=1 Tax=Syngnathoides biaculeatus TaxID=300417 RepID=UPI002ADD6E45|nr:CD3e molecule, epsilon associated protein isoform X2 [Syngnathoides biaculeatus]
MPRDISPSSSDDEAAMSPAEATPKPKEVEKSRRYECPQDFESSGRRPCGGTLAETLRSGERELWLVKTPAGFDPRWSRDLTPPVRLRIQQATKGGAAVKVKAYLARPLPVCSRRRSRPPEASTGKDPTTERLDGNSGCENRSRAGSRRERCTARKTAVLGTIPIATLELWLCVVPHISNS